MSASESEQKTFSKEDFAESLKKLDDIWCPFRDNWCRKFDCSGLIGVKWHDGTLGVYCPFLFLMDSARDRIEKAPTKIVEVKDAPYYFFAKERFR